MRKLKYILLIIIALIAQNIFSQSGKIVIILKQPPPLAFKLENMWNVTLQNTGTTSIRVYLRGIATETSEGFIAEATTAAFNLPPGVKVVTAADIKPIKIERTNPKYEDVVKIVGTVPSGSYEICVTAHDAADNSELGSECYLTDVLNISQVELLSPEGGMKYTSHYDETAKTTSLRDITMDESQTASAISFNWLPPTPLSPGQRLSYKLKIVQVYGRQSSYDAMQSNPLYYSAASLVSTIYQYPVAARSLSTGTYAWQVEAYVNGVLMSTSEVWDFQIGEEPVSLSKSKNLAMMKKYWALNDSYFPSTGSENQTKNKPFKFAFDSKLYGEQSNRSGTGSDKKPQYGYWEINPSLSAYGLPLSIPILLSTENSESRQNINMFGLNLDASVVKDFIMERIEKEKDKILEKTKKEISKMTDKQKDKLEKDAGNSVMSKLPGLLKIVSAFRSLGFGTTYPDYTPLTVRGVPLSGVSVEFNPGLLYIAVGGFKNQKPIDNIAFRRDIYTGRLGIGQKDASHFYLTGMYANDKESSITLDSNNQTLTPKANYLFGMEGKLELFRKKLTLEGEISGAMLTRDTRAPDLESNAIPQFVKNMVHPKISSSVDYSYTLKGVFNNEKSATKFTAGLRMLGPGYVSLGVPNLSTDKLEFTSKIEQKLAEKKISLTGSFLWYKDNLIDWKRNTTSVTRFSLTANFRFKNIPFVSLTYAPTFMKNDATDLNQKLDNSFHVLSIFTGHNFTKWDANFNSSLSYFMNSSSNLDSIITQNVSVHNLVFSQSVSFKIPLSISGSVGLSFARYPEMFSRIVSADFNASYLLFDVMNYMMGVSTAYEKDLNKKNTLYIGTSIGYERYINLEIRAEKNLYHQWNDPTGNYDEFLMKGIITANF
ncbi:MAG: hypothetical protein K8I03_06915 [Ignavibacteria bacterium]|nr:hypothetical protein [Ignavibacteria bacterium]